MILCCKEELLLCLEQNRGCSSKLVAPILTCFENRKEIEKSQETFSTIVALANSHYGYLSNSSGPPINYVRT